MSASRFFKSFKYPIVVSFLTVFLTASYIVFKSIHSNIIPRTNPVKGNCDSVKEQNQKIQCWQNLLDTEIKEKGLTASFALLEKLYAENKDFSGPCHGFTHTIGMEAYRLFKIHKDFWVPPSVSACNYGFYHGFMEVLLTRGGDLKEAQKFCDYIDKQLGFTTPDAPGQCFHGIGHGNAGIHDKRYWGNAPAIITQSLELCERVSDTSDRLYRCASGVYNALSDFYANGEFGFSMDMIDKKDPHRLCREQPKKYRQSCYGNMKSIIDKITGRDFQKVASIVSRIPVKEDAEMTIWYFAGYLMKYKINLKDYTKDISICRSIKSFLHLPCIKGLMTGFLWNSTPGSEYIQAFDFCRLQTLTKEERQACYGELIQKLPEYYSLDKVKEICSSEITPKEWKDECSKVVARRKK